MIVLIPAYQPDERLIDLVAALEETVVVVDDGSGEAYRQVFDEVRGLGARVLTLARNRGKGFALKTGFAEIAKRYPGQSIVCADCDGQHTPADIARVAAAVEPGSQRMVLGVRAFTGPVPARSRVGNAVSRMAYRLTTGIDVRDTQTGLRAYPAALLGWLCGVDGDRFEYEFNLLLQAKAAGVVIDQVDIATVYLAANASSHFRPVADSVRIYAPLLKFVGSSLLGFVIDTLALLVLTAAGMGLVLAAVLARVTSGAVNYTVNRTLVFDDATPAPSGRSAVSYALLALGLFTTNVLVLWLLTAVGVPLLAAKIAVEMSLGLTSYAIQRRVIFPPALAVHQRDRVRAG